MDMEYTVVRSKRRTISIEITEDAKLLVRAPMRLSLRDIERFVEDNSDWVENHTAKVSERNRKVDNIDPISENELAVLYTLAEARIPERVAYYADILGVTYGKISVRKQKTMWASCTAKGDLSFNCLLMKAPAHVRDYVIVHELCHRLEMNHSKRFWQHVASVIPDYSKCRKWLREEGVLIMGTAKDV